ncbi:hypothetical protein [Streptomyces reniochalinae]|uniref:Uncharacterized protein n=1 Tax=Streptomyces reniochalinae TaxID=2250578 RepID=A0A367F6G0_9ACTN|nr:hypothetical protein [Streptomyces reniochalinae]RCG25267.1 hypothetical protein DQ392_01865 [Streptomyces reniochalinae]
MRTAYDAERGENYAEVQGKLTRFGNNASEWVSSKARGMLDVLQKRGKTFGKAGYKAALPTGTGMAKLISDDNPAVNQWANVVSADAGSLEAGYSLVDNARQTMQSGSGQRPAADGVSPVFRRPWTEGPSGQ